MSSRSFLKVVGAFVLWGCSGGGEADATPVATMDASSCIDAPRTGSGNCVPELSPCWTPVWKPPNASRNACTEAQLVDYKSKCYGADPDPTCEPFERDRENATCLQCLLSTAEEPGYGALVLLPNGGLQSNIPGCLALVDGDTSVNGCGARYQAYYQCLDAACMENCSSYDDYKSCSTTASTGVCAPFLKAAACRLKPSYATCTKYSTFDEYFFAMGRVFCVQAADAGNPSDAGAPPNDRIESEDGPPD